MYMFGCYEAHQRQLLVRIRTIDDLYRNFQISVHHFFLLSVNIHWRYVPSHLLYSRDGKHNSFCFLLINIIRLYQLFAY